MIGFGLPRLVLAIVAVRGLSSSATAIRAAAVRAVTVLFGWCVDDSVFSFCLGFEVLIFWGFENEYLRD